MTLSLPMEAPRLRRPSDGEALETILCVDHEAALRRQVVEHLRAAGYDTLEAADGREGLALILRRRPALVLCAIGLPRMSGHELLATVRGGRHENGDVPFVLLSARPDGEEIILGRRLGADDHIATPVDFDLLLATIGSRIAQVRRIQARQRAEMARLGNVLLHTLPHELRTPLNHVIGFSEMMRERLYGPLTADYDESVAHILAGGNRLLTVANGILDLIEASLGAAQPDIAACELSLVAAAALDAVLALREPPLARVGTVWRPVIVATDGALVGRCLQAIIDNALKFTPADGSVTVRIEACGRGGARLTVSDTGIGMRPERIPLALAPFGRLEEPVPGMPGGSGIGLTLADAIAHRLGGRLAVASRLGTGTTVTLTLPGQCSA